MMTGISKVYGIRMMAAKRGTPRIAMITAMRLPVYMLAMRPHTKSGRSLISIGPGCSPQMKSPPSITATVAEVGIPSVIMGRSAPVPAALSAVSQEMTPSTTPVPNFSGCFENRLATL